MRARFLYFLFFCSGISGLIYQVAWVRGFGNAFGNTVHSASLVIAIFMLGLGVGGYLAGAWADRRYQTPNSLLRVYARMEGVIGALGLMVSLVLPHLGSVIAGVSWYTNGAGEWHTLSAASYVARVGVAVLLLTPITLLMGGTLTVLIRYLVRSDLRASGSTIAMLYGANTAGAALGAFLTDFAFVPVAGLYAAQIIAVALNVVAGAGAYLLARTHRAEPDLRQRSPAFRSIPAVARRHTLRWTSLALVLSGFGAMGMEILWLRHAHLLLGGFRAVFSLLLAIMLAGLGAGAWFGGWLDRRTGRPAQTLMVLQACFVASVLLGLASADSSVLMAEGQAIAAAMTAMGPARRTLAELWYNTRPMLLEVGVPALVAGCAFPLANALVQHVEHAVGRRAGFLYLANTFGAVCASLVTGYLLLPRLGIQSAATVLACVSALAIVPLYLASRGRAAFITAGLTAGAALASWLALPGDFVLRRALVPQQASERVVAMSEGVTELVAVVDVPGRGRGLITNGHAMSSTAPLDQRYMRALAHVPLLSMANPERVLVIGFGVGNTVHAATLHPSVRRVDVVDLSRHVLDQADYFRDANQGVLQHEKVSVYVNDGRQHLQMAGAARYDLITLEPPPIAHAGVAALYSREFYELARSRLTPGGYVSQWLPAYQVPSESSLAMVRAFVDVFPQAVLLSGAQADLLLLGTTAARIEIDPAHIQTVLDRAPAVRADLARLDLGTPREIVGMFVGSPATLASATRGSPAATDDNPLQEYGVHSTLTTGLLGVPAELFDLEEVAAWCPQCFQGESVSSVAGLDLYLALLGQAYSARVADVEAAVAAVNGPRRVDGSAYLGAVLPDSAEVHNILGVSHLRAGSPADAMREFEAALARKPDLVSARQNLGQVRDERGAQLLEAHRYADAAAEFREALALLPDSAGVHNNLGVALASMGRVAEAREHFLKAVELKPDFAEARGNLAASRTP
ncbi:MAG TPA: fused MFS/spermidine synthase [Vicinamibacterales bacterium]|nr:fused MFS/spermidine synthase [Vicinamibacterales bacterium]